MYRDPVREESAPKALKKAAHAALASSADSGDIVVPILARPAVTHESAAFEGEEVFVLVMMLADRSREDTVVNEHIDVKDAQKVAVDLAPPRYDLVVEALGGHGEYCARPDEIRPALERAFASGKPALVNVMIRKDEGAPKGSTYV